MFGGVWSDSTGKVWNGSEWVDAWSAGPPESEWIALVPKMTSDTTPSGEASRYPIYANTPNQWQAWTSFNWDVYGNAMMCIINGTSGYIQYRFENPVTVRKILSHEWNQSVQVLNSGFVKDMEFYISDNGTNWTKVGEATNPTNTYGVTHTHYVTNYTEGRYFRISMLNNFGNNGYTYPGKLQFYGY